MSARKAHLLRELVGLALLFWAIFLVVSLLTYSRLDPSINQVVSHNHVVRNAAGLVGSYTSGLMVDFLGIGAFLVPVLCLYFALFCFLGGLRIPWWRWLGVLLLSATLMTWAQAPWANKALSVGDVSGGGIMGRISYTWSHFLLRKVGAVLVWIFLAAAGLQLALGLSWTHGLPGLGQRLRDLWRSLRQHTAGSGRAAGGGLRGLWLGLMEWWDRHREEQALRRQRREEREEDDEDVTIDFDALVGSKSGSKSAAQYAEDPQESSTPAPARQQPPVEPAPRKVAKSKRGAKASSEGPMPSLDLLDPPPAGQNADMKALEALAVRLVATLEDFGISGEVARIVPGPVVTMFEYKPAPGIKISRIAGLSDELAMTLKATAVRIEAIPGKDAVGVEIPNEQRQTVGLRQVLESDAFRSNPSKLALALGTDIRGAPYVADLAKMPHLLVAGATGAGKSVSLNGIILSLLYKARPDEVKLLLVDPKRIELSVYRTLPHLVHPVVTEMSMAKSALEWAVAEMDRRYEAMAQMGVRNIDGYNEKLAKGEAVVEQGEEAPEPMPYLVLIIDELADLMMTAGKEAEISIVRLAQLARAAGIHLILATQRPSVDVVTGLIKANFPSRISFQVTSKHDSRTILDTVGSERLLGRGDSLVKIGGSKLKRVHGAYVSEDEIAHVVNYWASQVAQDFQIDLEAWQAESADGGGVVGEAGALDGDELYRDAVDFVMSQGKASISLLQRRFRIGFNRAARFIEQMEMDGMLGPQEGAKPRAVIKTE